ncbi:uncharacterized protein LOC135215346 [Macrobrachium nipponense]|uniref:uncharacterized protein LOC135215346 n=1 Tax=Macrobrachium nipponense TaxID=159736 RepID=UPI0030C7A9FD
MAVSRQREVIISDDSKGCQFAAKDKETQTTFIQEIIAEMGVRYCQKETSMISYDYVDEESRVCHRTGGSDACDSRGTPHTGKEKPSLNTTQEVLFLPTNLRRPMCINNTSDTRPSDTPDQRIPDETSSPEANDIASRRDTTPREALPQPRRTPEMPGIPGLRVFHFETVSPMSCLNSPPHSWGFFFSYPSAFLLLLLPHPPLQFVSFPSSSNSSAPPLPTLPSSSPSPPPHHSPLPPPISPPPTPLTLLLLSPPLTSLLLLLLDLLLLHSTSSSLLLLLLLPSFLIPISPPPPPSNFPLLSSSPLSAPPLLTLLLLLLLLLLLHQSHSFILLVLLLLLLSPSSSSSASSLSSSNSSSTTHPPSSSCCSSSSSSYYSSSPHSPPLLLFHHSPSSSFSSFSSSFPSIHSLPTPSPFSSSIIHPLFPPPPL